jgi:hypothetical protein
MAMLRAHYFLMLPSGLQHQANRRFGGYSLSRAEDCAKEATSVNQLDISLAYCSSLDMFLRNVGCVPEEYQEVKN